MEYLSWSLLLLGGLILLMVYFISRSQRSGKDDYDELYCDDYPEQDGDDLPPPSQNAPATISESDARSHVLSNLSHELETINQLLGRDGRAKPEKDDEAPPQYTESPQLEQSGDAPHEHLEPTLPEHSDDAAYEHTEPTLPEQSVMGDLFADQEELGPSIVENSQPEKIITLHICARNNEQLAGKTLARVFDERNYEFGEMDIYHSRFDGITVFSIVNMTEPGNFDRATMDQFSTPGISLFLRLPGPLAADVAFDVLLNEAREIARQLNAVILDASRSTLTLQMEQHIHEELKQFDFKQKRSKIV